MATCNHSETNVRKIAECNGKVTIYEYDVAGWLVKKGDKAYSYIGLEKLNP